ncbi:MAG: hypothetical protein LBN71_10070 [Tannerella sp.]|jgi:hypothetical protein|nr:hypothetical protein [Tannerella sp.]
MEYPNPKIRFYQVRTFGEKLNITFDFFREAWKPLLKSTLYLILPICLIQAFGINAIMRFSFAMGASSGAGSDFWQDSDIWKFFINYSVYMLCYLVGSCLLSALIYTLMQEYQRRETRLLDIQLSDFKEPLIKNTWKMLRMSLLFFGVILLVALIIGILAAMSSWTLILTLPVMVVGLIAVIVPVSLAPAFYIFEDMPLGATIRKAFRYGFAAWGGTFGILFVLGLLGNIISSVTMMPWYILTVIGSFFSITDPSSGVHTSILYQFSTYILGIIQSYGTYIGATLSVVGTAFQYFHLREKNEGVTVNENIQNFYRL